jgi:hypothetical protein
MKVPLAWLLVVLQSMGNGQKPLPIALESGGRATGGRPAGGLPVRPQVTWLAIGAASRLILCRCWVLSRRAITRRPHQITAPQEATAGAKNSLTGAGCPAYLGLLALPCLGHI